MTGEIPELGKCAGRPKKPVVEAHIQLVKQTYEKYRVCASRLEKHIEKDFKLHIPHNSIHAIMVELGLAKLKGKKDVRKKKWVRYERRHSLTAIHLDWVYHPELKLYALPVIDDASRKLLALVETTSATTDASIDAIRDALKHGEIKQCITDHGTQFCAGEDEKARFPAFLKQHGIKPILCRIKHPQSNGKSEKFGHLYKVHRNAFQTKEDFMHWYNEVRPHMSLDEQTPEKVYQERKHPNRRYYT